MITNATVIYSTALDEVMMIVLDANNLAEPYYNQPGFIQIPIEPVAYQDMTPEEFQDYINTIKEQMQGNV